MGKIFGIDLGTTYSCISYIDENGKPVVVKNSEGDLTTPSVVHFESPEDVHVGSSAKESAQLYPDQVVTFIKRHIGEPGFSLNINGVDYKPQDILKNEEINLHNYRSEEELYTAVEQFAYVKYNHIRPHSYNGYRTPFEARYTA